MNKVISSNLDIHRSSIPSLKFDKINVPISRDFDAQKIAQTHCVNNTTCHNIGPENDSSKKENVPENSFKTPSGSKYVSLKHTFNVGFAQLPNQIFRKTNHRGFTFNIIVAGATGLGKSTFINTLFMSDVYNEIYQGASIRFLRDQNTSSVGSAMFNLKENGVNLSLTIIDTPGFAESLDNSTCFQPLLEEISRRNAECMEAEFMVNRSTVGSGCEGSDRLGMTKDPLVHACFYFLAPTGHAVRQIDLEAMRVLGDKVNLIPVIAKADTMTTDECSEFKAAVREQLSRENIQIYDFPFTALPEKTSADGRASTDLASLRLRQPFAVCTSTQEVTKSDGTKVRCRVYPWGVVETDSLEHNDFPALKTLLMRHFMHNLIEVTYTKHYSNYRSNRLTEIMQNANFNITEGREPLSQLDAEKKAHSAKLDTLVKEMNQVYVDKVREREIRLKNTESDMLERIESMRQQLIAETEEVTAAKQKFYEERVAWELENRDLSEIQEAYLETVKVGECATPQTIPWWHLKHRSRSTHKGSSFYKHEVVEQFLLKNKSKRSASAPSKDLGLVDRGRSTSVPRITWTMLRKKKTSSCKSCKVCEMTGAQAYVSPTVNRLNSNEDNKENRRTYPTNQTRRRQPILKLSKKESSSVHRVSVAWMEAGAPLAYIDSDD